MRNIIKYSNGQHAPLSACDAGLGMLSHTEEKLHLAYNELLRMEDEGGIPLSGEQNAKVNAYFKASKRIKKLLFITGNRAPKI